MNSEKFTVPSTQFTERPEAYELKVSLPGIGKEDAAGVKHIAIQ